MFKIYSVSERDKSQTNKYFRFICYKTFKMSNVILRNNSTPQQCTIYNIKECNVKKWSISVFLFIYSVKGSGIINNIFWNILNLSQVLKIKLELLNKFNFLLFLFLQCLYKFFFSFFYLSFWHLHANCNANNILNIIHI